MEGATHLFTSFLRLEIVSFIMFKKWVDNMNSKRCMINGNCKTCIDESKCDGQVSKYKNNKVVYKDMKFDSKK